MESLREILEKVKSGKMQPDEAHWEITKLFNLVDEGEGEDEDSFIIDAGDHGIRMPKK